mgnify:CR=1 FL=1|jgi:hypothetical protein
MATTFERIMDDAVKKGVIPAKTTEARKWFRTQAKNTTTNPTKLMREERGQMVTRPTIGRMYLFNYDPKLKDELPYYDTFPLIFMVGPAEGGFYGLNMHYLPFTLRARLMDALYGLSTDQSYDEDTRLRLSYRVLKAAGKYKFFKPTFKHYLRSKVKSRFVEIYADQWDMALFLPLSRFKKASESKVWSDSRKQV